MKTHFLCLLLVTLATTGYAEDLSFAYEGNPALRKRLEQLQGSTDLPKLKLKNWENSRPYSLADLKGKIVVLDFWATWCGPCIGSIPKNNQIAEKYKDDVIIIGICAEKGSGKMQAVVAGKGIQYPVAIDVEDQTNAAYQANGYPDYYVIDQSGRLVVADCNNSDVEAVIKRLLAQ
ncbi:MAG: cytochrome c biogenesis protein CcmG/thiol:disulfide interchange protein DsbE [Lentimonas sp.]|jgi:cytochrome c biogenesis protein CcmG/thiol:disulfide interchange protein DsbE